MTEVPATPLIVVVGATASGKSGLSIQLAHRLADAHAPAEIISADSMQLYRGMDIGTAKLTGADQEGVPHHLLDRLDITEEASVATYQSQARKAITDIRRRGGTPILAGGSGLYVRAVIDSIEFPPTDQSVRTDVTQLLQTHGAAEVRRQLREVDAESAAVIRDERRLIRALEVVRLTGRAFTSYMPQRVHHHGMEPVIQLGLSLNRESLHRRIEYRVRTMDDDGLLDEVRDLEKAGLRSGRTASRAIGYQQYLRVVDGEITQKQAMEETIIATRKFARRQETWFRADPRITWIPSSSAGLVGEAMETIRTKTG